MNSWERKGYTIYDRKTFGNLNVDFSNFHIAEILESQGVDINFVPLAGYSSYDVVRMDDGSQKAFYTQGVGFGLYPNTYYHLIKLL